MHHFTSLQSPHGFSIIWNKPAQSSHSSAMPEKSPLTSFPVLKLPSEIRTQIWRYAVVKNGDVKIGLRRLRRGHESQGHQAGDERRMNPTPLALALTSRQLYLEAVTIYYGENIFDFYINFSFFNYEMLKEFIAAVGPQNASSITAARFVPTKYDLERVYCPIDPFLSVLPLLKQIIIYVPSWVPQLPLYASPKVSLVDACAQSHPSAVIEIL